MSSSFRLARPGRTRSRVLRYFFLILGSASVLWAGALLPIFWSTVVARDVSDRILVDDRFKLGAVAESSVRVEGLPRGMIAQSSFERAVAVIRTRVSEDSLGKGVGPEADRDMKLANDSIRAALYLNPTDSFLWFMLYSVSTTRNGFDAGTAKFLAQSYVSGPLEGWIALRRNSIALVALDLLQEQTRAFALREFAALVDSDFVSEAETNLTKAGWAHRSALVESLETVDLAPKERLSRMLVRDRIDLPIPHVNVEKRPWN